MDGGETERAALEAAEAAVGDPHGRYAIDGLTFDEAMAQLESLMARGLADADHQNRGDDRLISARGIRLTPAGQETLKQWRAADDLDARSIPTDPSVVWQALRRHAERFSPLDREIDDAVGDLEQRGMFSSGPSIKRAMQIAFDHGLRWSPTSAGFEASLPFTSTASPQVPDRRKVFVVHGRDSEAQVALFDFLRALGLEPMVWEDVVALTGTGSPWIFDVLVRGFQEAQAAVVLLTPDDEARLHVHLRGQNEPPHETQLTCQPRPNVLIEAGMALAFQPDRTIIVQIGQIRPATDLSGRHVVHLGSSGSLLALARRLQTAGCPANLTASDIMNDGRFAKLKAREREATTAAQGLPKGHRLDLPVMAAAPAELRARLVDRGRNDHLLELQNRGGVPLNNLQWTIPDDAQNWSILSDVLPEYPIARLDPRDHVRIPVAVSLGGPAIVRVTFHATLPDGSPFERVEQLSVYG